LLLGPAARKFLLLFSEQQLKQAAAEVQHYQGLLLSVGLFFTIMIFLLFGSYNHLAAWQQFAWPRP
jgi:hypothetical protein